MRAPALLGLLLLLFALGCGAASPFEAVCADDATKRFATDPATGACWQFPSSCDVPASWTPCAQPGELPPAVTCSTNAMCAPQQICPAQLGVCDSLATAPNGVTLCTSTCRERCDTPGAQACAPGTHCEQWCVADLPPEQAR